MKIVLAILILATGLGFGGAARADFQDGLKAAQSGDFATALREWRPLAEQGDAVAQYNLGLMYDNGEGVLQDDREAVKWWRLAAEQGLANAQVNLGFMYDKGAGVLQDILRSHMWSNIASANGNKSGGKHRDIDAKNMTPTQIEKALAMARRQITRIASRWRAREVGRSVTFSGRIPYEERLFQPYLQSRSAEVAVEQALAYCKKQVAGRKATNQLGK